jgi:hypothetical protein
MPLSRGKSTGAKNPAVQHGYYTKASIASRQWLNELLKEVNQVIAGMEN